MLNLTLPGQHPDPEAVALQIHRMVNASMARREMLGVSVSEKDVASCLTGNPIDDCWKCDPNWANNRQRLADCAIGFGQNAKGGKGGEFYIVTDSSDEDPVNPKPGTLRYAVIQNEPLWIVFPTNMMIKLSQELIFNSYKTIDGRGADVHIVGGGCITLQYISNVIIHNIHIHHCHPSGNANVRSSPEHYGYRTESDGDGISIFGSNNIWIDHCTLSRCKDGLIDAVMGSTGITISNNHFSHHNDVMLLGHSDQYLPDSAMQVTIAFNHFGDNLVQRMPRCRLGYIHVVTKRLDAREGDWTAWNWRSQGDVMFNGAFFVASGAVAQPNYRDAYSVEPKSVDRISLLTMSAGVLGVARDNNLGMWTRGSNDYDGVSFSDFGPHYTDDMSPSTMQFLPSSFFILLSAFFSHITTTFL
uniref:Pectate lyase n=2 Tax=Cajanus cajan TaxID=3821 RepID=A0A151RH79_CAJCA|nr:putative pectate lyase 12 [Cajanus cajan]